MRRSTKGIKLLVVDDEQSVRSSLEKWFLEDGYEVAAAGDAYEALECLERGNIHLVVLDIKMPGMDGLELQKRIKKIDENIAVIMMTAYGSVETAVQALKQGAYDYVVKPFNPEDLSRLVRNAAEQIKLKNENLQLRSKIHHLSLSQEIIGESEPIKRVLDLVKSVAGSDATVVIRGESGTGKELVARAIHSHSARRFHPIVPVNCGALTETLLESELFGHEKGAFTGAQGRRKGKFEMADGGTLFLDEIGNISQKMQMQLLRVLETRQFTRVGGNSVIEVDLRLICATNKNLEKAVEEGSFREDLYYRINVFNIVIPPLRERPTDIPLLVKHFVEKYAMTMNRPILQVTSEAMDVLMSHSWPGNVRELENAIERAMVVGHPPAISPRDLPIASAPAAPEKNGGSDSLAAAEKRHIAAMLARTNWNISRSAKKLEIDRVTLYNKIRKYGLRK